MTHRPLTRARRRAPILAILSVAAAVSAGADATPLTFEQVFSSRHEPSAMHYQTVFVSGGVAHHLAVWRDGDRRIKRQTDDTVEVYAEHTPGDADFRMSVLNKKKRLHTEIDRTNLYRIGNFTDWFDLGHGLRHPKGEYQLTKAAAPDGAPKAIERCTWFDLTRDHQVTHICWNTQRHLPLLIQSQQGTVVWRITAIDQHPIPPKTFDIQDAGYVHTNANEDIEKD